jgi:hypothetical protein
MSVKVEHFENAIAIKTKIVRLEITVQSAL